MTIGPLALLIDDQCQQTKTKYGKSSHVKISAAHYVSHNMLPYLKIHDQQGRPTGPTIGRLSEEVVGALQQPPNITTGSRVHADDVRDSVAFQKNANTDEFKKSSGATPFYRNIRMGLLSGGSQWKELQSQVQLHSQLAKNEKLLEREKLRGRAMRA